MQTKTCPDCGDDIYVNAKSHKCGWKLVPDPVIHREPHRMTPEAKAVYEGGAPRSHDLTPQQWYNVCRFWSSVARRCSRPMEKVGPDHPLHATSNMGPLTKAMMARSVSGIDPDGEGERRRIEAQLEREAIQSEP